MKDVREQDAWFGEEVRRLTSDDGKRQAVHHSRGWGLYVVVSKTAMMGNPFGLCGGGLGWEISETSACAFVEEGTMPPEYVNLQRSERTEKLFARFLTAVKNREVPHA